MQIHKLFEMMVRYNSSDLHIKSGQPPVFRVSGQLTRLQNTPPMTGEDTQKLLMPTLSEDQRQTLEERGNVDFAYGMTGIGRFRMNVYMQRGALSAAIRKVNLNIPNYDDLNLPSAIARLAQFEQGLVLIGGVTGSGKSTSLASILNDINANRRCHILTIEDPIEYLFQDDKAIINQREIGIDVMDFDDALRSAVRQDPDVMLVGEMRDAETFETALTAAETGHLVFGTIHSSGAPQTIGRLLDYFSPTASTIKSAPAWGLICAASSTKSCSRAAPRRRRGASLGNHVQYPHGQKTAHERRRPKTDGCDQSRQGKRLPNL